MVRFEWHRRNRDGSLHWDEVMLKAATIGGKRRVLSFAREISDRKRAEQALRASEEQYRAIFEAATDSLQLLDAQHRVVDVNPAYERMYGKRRDEVIGKTLTELVPAPLRQERRALVERALAGEAAELLTTGFRGDGTPFDLEVRVIPFRHRGEPHVLGIARDITGRKKAEEAMRASEEQYRAIFNASADALVLRAADFHIVDVNATYERMSGWTRDEVLGLDGSSPIRPRLPRRSVRLHGARWPARRLRSRCRWCGAMAPALRPRAARGPDPAPRRAACAVHGTRCHRAQAVRRRRCARAKSSTARSSMRRRMPWCCGTSSTAASTSISAYQAMYGWAREDVIGKGYEDPRFPAEYAKPRLELLRRAWAARTARRSSRRFALMALASGREVHAIPFRHRGEPHVLAIARDITERKQSEEALRASEEQYRAIFNASADAMLLRDDTMTIVDANPAFLALCGLPREQVIGKSRAPFVTEANEADADPGAARGDGRRAAARSRHRPVRLDGTVLDVDVRAMPMLYRGRRHVLAIARNITGDKRAEAERHRFEARLRQAQKMEAIGQLTGGIAHDFNNILASVMGYVGAGARSVRPMPVTRRPSIISSRHLRHAGVRAT